MRVHFGTCQNGPIATEVPDGRDTRKQARRYRASLRTPWHDSVGCLSSRLTELLSKANTYSGKALESAKRIFKGKVRKDAIRDTLPDAWNKIVGEPDSLLAELLAETTERLCGFKPDEAEAAEFIRQHQDILVLTLRGLGPSGDGVKAPVIVEPGDKEKPDYIEKYRNMLKNPNSLPSKVKKYIDEKGPLSQADLKRACVKYFGCKSETSGSISASLRVLELDRHVRSIGRGDDKMISSSQSWS